MKNFELIDAAIARHRASALRLEEAKRAFVEGKTLQEVGDILGISRQAACDLRVKYHIVSPAEERHLEWRRSLGQDVTEIVISEAQRIWGVKYESARMRLKVLGIKVNKQRYRRQPPRERVEAAFANYASATDAAVTLGVQRDTAMRYADFYGIPRRKNKKRAK